MRNQNRGRVSGDIKSADMVVECRYLDRFVQYDDVVALPLRLDCFETCGVDDAYPIEINRFGHTGEALCGALERTYRKSFRELRPRSPKRP